MARINQIFSLGLLSLIIPSALSAPTTIERSTSAKLCVDLQVPVDVVAQQWRYDQPTVESNIDAIDWTVNVTTWSPSNFTARQLENITVTKEVTISARLCVPSNKTDKSSILQIASPGQAFDKRYFDVEIEPKKYSYVDAAIAEGYSVLSYDRLGTGESSTPDAYDELQVPLDVEILAGLTKIARSGNLIKSSKIVKPASSSSSSGGGTVSDFVPSKIVHIGHAYGSFLMVVLLGQYGALSDGAVMTGLYFNSVMMSNPLSVLNYNHAYAAEAEPERFAKYGSGYIVLDNENTLQKLFYQKATLDPKLLAYTEKIKQPESVGQYASEGDAPFVPANDFKGPLLVSV
jgi:hypothetical protein